MRNNHIRYYKKKPFLWCFPFLQWTSLLLPSIQSFLFSKISFNKNISSGRFAMLHKNSFGACTLNSHLGWSKVFQRWYARITSALRDFPREWERVKSFWLCTPISIMQLRVELKLHPTLVKDQNTMRQNINTKVVHVCQKISLSVYQRMLRHNGPDNWVFICPKNYNMVLTS